MLSCGLLCFRVFFPFDLPASYHVLGSTHYPVCTCGLMLCIWYVHPQTKYLSLVQEYCADFNLHSHAAHIWQVQTSLVGTDNTPIYEMMGPPPVSDSCYPSNFNPVSTAYYSPAMCPSGYSAAKTETLTIESLTETKHVCCPTYALPHLNSKRLVQTWSFRIDL